MPLSSARRIVSGAVTRARIVTAAAAAVTLCVALPTPARACDELTPHHHMPGRWLVADDGGPSVQNRSHAFAPAEAVGRPELTQERAQLRAGKGKPVDCATVKCIAFTFDDGPGDQIPEVMAILTQEHVAATFFFQGNYSARNPQYISVVANTPGMEIGNHSDTHPFLSRIPAAQATKEVATQHQLLLSKGAKDVRWLRPPYGATNARVAAAAAASGESVVTWNVNSLDYEVTTPGPVVKQVLSTAKPKGVVLMHDIKPHTVAALPEMIAGLKRQGYVIVNVSQLLPDATPGQTFEFGVHAE